MSTSKLQEAREAFEKADNWYAFDEDMEPVRAFLSDPYAEVVEVEGLVLQVNRAWEMELLTDRAR